MILNMVTKQDIRITDKSFHLENNVLILALEILDYDLAGKTVTAVFEPSKVETGALQVVDGVVQIPIYSSMVRVGVNSIQLNFRWDANKLEQSGKLMWVIDRSLETTGPAQEDVDIINYLITEINAAKDTADRVVSDVGDIKIALDQSVDDAADAKTALDGSIDSAGTTKTSLEGIIGDANTKKTELINTIGDANTKINEITNPTTGTIKKANDAKAALEGKITEAGTAKSEIEDAITNNQIVTLPVFNAHKEDYASKFPNNAGAHNSIFRGKYLGASVTPKQYVDIQNGSFEDLYVGDYWTIGGINWRIAAFNYYRNTGDSLVPGNHITIVPDTQLYAHHMNPTNITTGGYTGSDMYINGLEQAKTTIRGIFGSHLVKHRQLHSNATSNGKASGWAWVDSEVDLMSEIMIYGSTVWGESTIGGTGYNIGVGKSQLPLFALNPQSINTRQSFWLRDVISSANFALVDTGGLAGSSLASRALGVRPAFSIS